MTCRNRIVVPCGQDKQGDPDNYAKMCEARRLFALAWWDWLCTAPPPSHIAAESEATIGQVTGLTELVAGA